MAFLFTLVGAGWLGFVGYASGNIFLDAFARKHNQTENTPWISVNWDTWQMQEDAHGVLGATIAAFAMQPEEALEALTRILASGMLRLVNSTGNLHARLLQWGRLEALRESNGAELDRQIAATRASSAPVPVGGDYEQEIMRIWQQVLGMSEVGLYDNFFDLGGNSLIGLQVISKLKKAFNMPIPAVALYEAPTVSASAHYLTCRLNTEADNETERDILKERRRSGPPICRP